MSDLYKDHKTEKAVEAKEVEGVESPMAEPITSPPKKASPPANKKADDKKKEPKEKITRWAQHIHLSPLDSETLEDALTEAGITTPELLLQKSHELDAIIRGLIGLTKGKLIKSAKELLHKDGGSN